jgi:hypothetical protein
LSKLTASPRPVPSSPPAQDNDWETAFPAQVKLRIEQRFTQLGDFNVISFYVNPVAQFG